MIKAFPKIFAIGTDYIKDIFLDEVEITEKIDGSQFSFGKVNGEIYMRSKGCIQYKEKHDKMFSLAVAYALSIESLIPDGMVFYCEYLKTERHNILKYNRVPKNHLIMFGASSINDSFVSNWRDYAEEFYIEAVPEIFKGHINSSDEIIKLLETESVLGGCKIEGIVVKNYAKPFLLGGQPIPLMSGKFVSEAFKENHKENWGKEYSSKGKWETFLESFKTEALWNKSIQRLEEESKLEHSPRDIGMILKEINKDIESEQKEDVKEFLWNEHKREIFANATRGLPEWYKEKLLKNSFENNLSGIVPDIDSGQG